jgi:hypothetical protein
VQEEEKLEAASEKQDIKVNSNERKNYENKCGQCGKLFRFKIGLNLHIRTRNCKMKRKFHNSKDEKNLAEEI